MPNQRSQLLEGSTRVPGPKNIRRRSGSPAGRRPRAGELPAGGCPTERNRTPLAEDGPERTTTGRDLAGAWTVSGPPLARKL
jgi:hypothetical protein